MFAGIWDTLALNSPENDRLDLLAKVDPEIGQIQFVLEPPVTT
jgi:hypothetical protein